MIDSLSHPLSAGFNEKHIRKQGSAHAKRVDQHEANCQPGIIT